MSSKKNQTTLTFVALTTLSGERAGRMRNIHYYRPKASTGSVFRFGGWDMAIDRHLTLLTNVWEYAKSLLRSLTGVLNCFKGRQSVLIATELMVRGYENRKFLSIRPFFMGFFWISINTVLNYKCMHPVHKFRQVFGKSKEDLHLQLKHVHIETCTYKQLIRYFESDLDLTKQAKNYRWFMGGLLQWWY